MSPDLEIKSQLENINTPAFSELNVLEPRENGETDDCAREMMSIEQTPLCKGDKDVEVNITECKNSGKALMVLDFGEDDVTESGSSFGDTGSGSENAVTASYGDPEVESQMSSDSAFSSMRDDWHESLRRRKKRTTDHWKRFISPITWRCKWIELKLRLLHSQERKYEKELAALNYTKQLDFSHLTLDGSGIKSVPISGRMHRNKVMKRKKRERVEEKCDLASHMSNHTLFSYYEKANCNVDVGLGDSHKVAIGGDVENLVEFKSSVDLWYSQDYYDNDKSWNDIIEKIIEIQSRVQNLKNKYEKVISENPGKFSSVNQLSILGPSDGRNHSDLKPDYFAGNASSGDHRIAPRDDNKDEDLTQYQVAKEELHEDDVHNVNVNYTLRSCSALKKSGLKRSRTSR